MLNYASMMVRRRLNDFAPPGQLNRSALLCNRDGYEITMANRIVPLLSFVASLIFFFVALFRDEARAVYIALGVLFLIIGGGSNRTKKGQDKPPVV